MRGIRGEAQPSGFGAHPDGLEPARMPAETMDRDAFGNLPVAFIKHAAAGIDALDGLADMVRREGHL